MKGQIANFPDKEIKLLVQSLVVFSNMVNRVSLPKKQNYKVMCCQVESEIEDTWPFGCWARFPWNLS
jgi:hypothetical protein